MELHLSYSFYPEIQEKNLWEDEKGRGGNYKETVRDEAGFPD